MLRGTDRHRDRADARDFLGRSRAGGEERGSPEPQMEPFARAARTQGRTAAQPRGLDRTAAERKLAAKSPPPPTHTSLSLSSESGSTHEAARAKEYAAARAARHSLGGEAAASTHPPRAKAGNSALPFLFCGVWTGGGAHYIVYVDEGERALWYDKNTPLPLLSTPLLIYITPTRKRETRR